MKIIFETLKKSSDFNIFRVNSEKTESEYFKILINGLCEGNDRIRLGYVINKKIGKSTVRNKLKRQIKEIFRNLKKDNVKSLNILFIAKKPILNLGFYSLKDQIYNYLQKYLQNDLPEIITDKSDKK